MRKLHIKFTPNNEHTLIHYEGGHGENVPPSHLSVKPFSGHLLKALIPL